MTLTEWGVLAMGLVLGFAVVSMLMSERKARPPKAGDSAPSEPRPDAAAASPAVPPASPPASPAASHPPTPPAP